MATKDTSLSKILHFISIYVPIILLVSIIILAIFNFIHVRSLWLDEAMLALNISNKSTLELLQPLELNQVAPIGFLLLEKGVITLIGSFDWALRIIPFIAYLAIILFYYKWCKVMTHDKVQSLISSILLAVTPIIIFYSSEVKQYETDVLCIVLIYFSSSKLFNEVKPNTRYIIISSLVVWFSNIAIIPLTTIAIAYGMKQLKKGDINFKILSLNIAPAFVSFAIYYLLFIQGHPSKEIMLDFWSNENAFLISNPFSTQFWLDFFDKINELLHLSPFHFSWIIIPFYFFGLVTIIFKRKWMTLLLVLLPILIHLCLSSLKLYPFSSRLILYLVPLVIFTWSFGLFEVINLIKLKKWTVLLISPLILLFALVLKNKLPNEKEELKVCLNHLTKNAVQNDDIYVYYGAQPAYKFYTEVQHFFNPTKFQIVLGSENRLERSKYQGDFDNSNYNWLVFSHAYWKEIDGMNEEEYIIQLAKENGYAIIDEFHQKGASLYQVEKH